MPTSLEVLEQALDQPPTDRTRYIEQACEGDEALRTQVMALLGAHARSEGFLEPSAVSSAPESIGPYRLLQQLGAGGMGVVYLGEREDGAFEQTVAVKLLPGRFHSAEVRRRAEAERRFLAALDHPNVARILDGGTTTDGQPYVVMEYIDGEPIDQYARRHGLDLRARIRLFLQVLAAVDAAHRALIVHRDIKPGNVLVTHQGQAKLLDFGIAKSLDATGGSEATRTGVHALTPQYASPEQLAGRPLTTACDVYALGLLLHELIAGQPAHPATGGNLYELERWLATHAPERPSMQVDARALGLSHRARTDWCRRIEGDLDKVVVKALEFDPARRYASAQAFSDDLSRWLEHRPVLARSGGRMYRIGKFLRRHRLQVAAAMVALVAILIGASIALHQGWRAASEAERARRANAFLVGVIGYSDPRVSGSPVTLVDALDHAAAQIPGQLSGQAQLEGDIRHALGEAYLGQDRTDAARIHLERAVALRADEGGNDYAASLTLLAMLEWRMGETVKAEALLRRALASCTRDAAGSVRRASVLGDFAGLLGDLGRFREALPMAEEAVRLGDALPGILPANRASSWNNLATSYYGLERFEEARDAFATAGALFQSIEPVPELDLSINYNNQAVLLHRMGRLDEALPLAKASIELKRRVMGEDYPHLVRPLSHLSRFYAEAGRHEAAETTMSEALRLAPRLYPEGDLRIGELHVSAAQLALLREDAEAAIEHATLAQSIFSTAPGNSRQGREAQALLDRARNALPPPESQRAGVELP